MAAASSLELYKPLVKELATRGHQVKNPRKVSNSKHDCPGDLGHESAAAPGRGREADRGEHPQLLLPVSG